VAFTVVLRRHAENIRLRFYAGKDPDGFAQPSLIWGGIAMEAVLGRKGFQRVVTESWKVARLWDVILALAGSTVRSATTTGSACVCVNTSNRVLRVASVPLRRHQGLSLIPF
jgi:hypothetical protein